MIALQALPEPVAMPLLDVDQHSVDHPAAAVEVDRGAEAGQHFRRLRIRHLVRAAIRARPTTSVSRIYQRAAHVADWTGTEYPGTN